MGTANIFKFENFEVGFCRIYFTYQGKLYCYMDRDFYVCSPSGEPDSRIILKEKFQFEMPKAEDSREEELLQSLVEYSSEHELLSPLGCHTSDVREPS